MTMDWNGGYHYVLLQRIYPDDTSTTVGMNGVAASNGYYNYAFTNISQGTYMIVAGSNRDNDSSNSDPGESVGAYPSIDQIMKIEATRSFNDLDFQTALRLNFSSSGMSEKPNATDPVFMRLKATIDDRSLPQRQAKPKFPEKRLAR